MPARASVLFTHSRVFPPPALKKPINFVNREVLKSKIAQLGHSNPFVRCVHRKYSFARFEIGHTPRKNRLKAATSRFIAYHLLQSRRANYNIYIRQNQGFSAIFLLFSLVEIRRIFSVNFVKVAQYKILCFRHFYHYILWFLRICLQKASENTRMSVL